jgi:hypothetical protein
VVISKIWLRDSASNTFNYCFRKSGARIIGGNVAPLVNRADLSDSEAAQLMQEVATIFKVGLSQNPTITHPVYHISLALPPCEHLSDADFSRLSDRYLAGFIRSGFDRSILENHQAFSEAIENPLDILSTYQFAQVLHTDRDHLHAHQIVMRPSLLDRRVIPSSFDRYRSQSILRYLEEEFGLEVQPSSWEPETRLKRILEGAVNTEISSDFLQYLQVHGVSVQRKKNRLIYTLDDTPFQDSDCGDAYTLQGLKAKGFDIPVKQPSVHPSQSQSDLTLG